VHASAAAPDTGSTGTALCTMTALGRVYCSLHVHACTPSLDGVR
jgi:hypothetical protein